MIRQEITYYPDYSTFKGFWCIKEYNDGGGMIAYTDNRGIYDYRVK